MKINNFHKKLLILYIMQYHLSYELKANTTMISQLTLIFFLSLVVIQPFHILAKTWCVAAASATDTQLQANIDWVCNEGKVDCVKINPGGVCYEPNTLTSHASFVMNDYYRNHGSIEEACDFNHTGQIISGDPSYRRCRYS